MHLAVPDRPAGGLILQGTQHAEMRAGGWGGARSCALGASPCSRSLLLLPGRAAGSHADLLALAALPSRRWHCGLLRQELELGKDGGTLSTLKPHGTILASLRLAQGHCLPGGHVDVALALDNRSTVPVKSVEVRGGDRVQDECSGLPAHQLGFQPGSQAVPSRLPGKGGQGTRPCTRNHGQVLPFSGNKAPLPAADPALRPLQARLMPIVLPANGRMQVGLERDILLREEPGCVASQHGFRELCSKHATAEGVPAGSAVDRWALHSACTCVSRLASGRTCFLAREGVP